MLTYILTYPTYFTYLLTLLGGFRKFILSGLARETIPSVRDSEIPSCRATDGRRRSAIGNGRPEIRDR